MKLPRLYLTIAAVLFSAVCYSQDNVENFNKYYLRSVEKLRDLYATRGAAFVCANIRDPFAQVQGMVRRYGEGLGVVFYSYSDDSLQIWLVRSDSFAYHLQKVKRDSLVKAEVDIRRAMKVDLLLAARDAKNRGVTITKKDETKRPGLDESLAIATNFLLPKPIAHELKGLQHLIIIPEFNISQFPLYLLKPFENNSYLIDSISISIAPHLCNLAFTLSEHEDYIGTPLAFYFDEPLIVGNPAYSKTNGFSLAPLPGAEAEADTIAALFDTKAIKGKEATISNVLQRAQTADLLYFATHGYADLEKGLAGSFLAFAPDSSSPTGLWNAKMIQDAKLRGKSSMAILSACQTGVGKVYDAGFIGIGRAFYKAGVSHTIMSLWSVDDTATTKLMTKFIKCVTRDELRFYPAGHLRKAILEFKKEDPDPAHWAPFMLFGFPY